MIYIYIWMKMKLKNNDFNLLLITSRNIIYKKKNKNATRTSKINN